MTPTQNDKCDDFFKRSNNGVRQDHRQRNAYAHSQLSRRRLLSEKLAYSGDGQRVGANNSGLECRRASTYYTASEILQGPPTFAGQVYRINVRTIVQNWANGTFGNNGFIFGSHDCTFPLATSFDTFAFYSREDTAGGGPKL